MLPANSHLATGLAATAFILCLLSATLPGWLAGDMRSAALGLLLLCCAGAVGLAAHLVHRPAAVPELRLIEMLASTLKDGLNTIKGFAELLGQDEPERYEGAGAARHYILDSSEELVQFLANLQLFVLAEQGRISLVEQQVDATELVEAALSTCRRTVERADVTIVARLLEGLDLCCDASRLRAAIANMVMWAAGAVPAGSMIHVSLHMLPGGRAGLDMAMPSPRLPGDCFLPQDGLRGLSLPVARRLALLHAGDITIGHDPDGRLILCLVLPAARVISPQQQDACGQRVA
jgi:hypothetical protein